MNTFEKVTTTYQTQLGKVFDISQISAHPRGAFISAGDCTPTEIKKPPAVMPTVR
jgi:hypothetical protein